MYTKVINNVISSVRYGIYINSFRISDPGDAGNRVISGNIIQSRQWGIWFNLYAAAHYETSNNTITAIADATRAKWYGIMLSTVSSPQNALSQLNLPLAPTPEKWSLINNLIDGSNLDPATSGIGYWLWYVDNNRDNFSNDHYGDISGGSVSNVDIGLYMHNVDTDPSTNFGQGRTGAHASVSNVNFSVNAGGKGIHLKDDPTWMTANIAPLVAKRNVNATINNSFITGGADGVLLEESEDDKVNAPMNNNSITGQTGNAIIATTLNSTVNATCNWYGTAVFANLPAIIAGNVDYVPYLNSGTDSDVPTAGFQPAAGTCVDGPVRVYSDNTETTLLSTHVTIQAGVNAAVDGNLVRVDAGTYNEDVDVNKVITVIGAGIDQSIVSGPIGGQGSTFRVGAAGVIIDGFTITRDGNNTTDWNNAGLNGAGVAVQGQTVYGEVRNCKITGNRSGIDINNSNGNNIHNNIITNNHTGMIFRNQTDNTILIENEITDNRTVGVLFLDASGGTNMPVQTALNSSFNNNKISGNWYGQIVDRQSGGSLPAPGTTNMKNFECNWYGTTAPVVTIANSAEPGYAALIPVVFGGMAIPPGGQPDIAGPASANFDYLLYLVNGTDDDAMAIGFQPTPLSCIGGCPGGGVVINTTTNEIFCSIQSAIDDANTLNGHTLTVAAGTYAENIVVSKSLTITGPNADIACGSRVAEAVIAPATGVPFMVTADDVTINGFEITAPSSTYGINFGNTSNVSIKFNYVHDIGTTVTNANVHAILYSVTSASKSSASITDNCLDNISSTSLSGWSAAAIGILQSASTGVLTGLNIERNTINDVQVNTGNWPTGKIAYGIQINVGGSGSYLSTSGEVVDAVIRNNVISNVSGFIATGIALEGNTKNAFVENNDVATLFGRKVDVRAGGGYDLNALKFENNRYVGTCTVQNNSFQTNTFTHDVTAGLGYAVANYVPAGVAYTGGGGGTTGEATLSCNWYGTAVHSAIIDNPALNGKIFNKDNCITNFVPYLVNGTDNAPAIGFQPHPTACSGGPVQVYNGPTFVSVHATIQGAIDAGTTVSGYTVRIVSGTYPENVDATAPGKNLTFAPGASPGCVNIVGNFTLNAMDVLEMEIDAATACTGYDQFTVSGTVTLGGATLRIPESMYFPGVGDIIKIIDGSNPISGMFASGNFVTTEGVGGVTYYISYAGNDVVLTQCCGALLDLGIYNYTAPTPAGNKLQVKLRPNLDVFNGTYSSSVFAIRTLTANGVVFTNLGSPFLYSQVPTDPMPPNDPIILIDGLYSYYFFRFDSEFTGVNWPKDEDVLLLTLGYSCVGNATFELVSDAFAIANGAKYYQELGAQNATGIILPTATTATSPLSVSIVATNNGPLCESMPIDLNSTASNGSPLPTPTYSYLWAGPLVYTNTVANPVPFGPATLGMAGIYTVTVTDGNGCTATGTTNVVVLANGGCVKNVDLTTYYPTITQAINVPETLNGHTLEVPAGNWPENVNVTKALTINGANVGKACNDPLRGAESIINGGLGTAVTIGSNGVTIDGFQIDGGTGISSTGFTKVAIINNKVNAIALGIGVSAVVTTAMDGYTIQDNCVSLAAQTVTPTTPTYGIALTAASGTQAVVLQDNHISDAFYGYGLFYVNASARTKVYGGTFTNLMQGVAVTNTLDGVTYWPSTVGVEALSMTSFAGNHPAIPAANFHSGVYVFTGGATPAAVVDILVDSVVVSNTGKISPNSAGIHFADFSTGAGNGINAEVKRSIISNNLNRGVYVRGGNATALVRNNEILFNGADPHGTGGNNGYGIIVNEEGSVSLQNNTITNPPAQAGIYPVTAMFIGVAPAGSITASENSINRNGNGSLTANTYSILQFDAQCNWWQSADIDVVDGLVDGNVTFVPYLNNGTDNSAARGFQPVPLSCVNPKRWYVNDNALTDDIFTLGLGDDANQGTKRRPFRTIGKAVMTAVSADTVYADAGYYNEQVVIPNTKNNMQIIGVGPCNAVAPALTTMVDFTGTVMGKPTLFDIAGDGTVIDGIHFKVDLSKLNSAIIATDLDPLSLALDNITIKNNCIDPYHSVANTYFGSYGNRNAISINYGGSTNYRMGGASGGVNNIIVDNNRVTATVVGPILGGSPNDDIGFRSAVSVDEGAGTYTRNTFQSINHDILVRFNSNGPVVIGGSVPNANTFLGGGVQYSDPNAGGGAVTISHNTFNGLVTASVMRLQDNYHNAPVTVSNNTLTNLRWGISLENFRNVTVADNSFTPLAGYTTFRHITVNTKTLTTDTTGITPQQINGVFTGNTFNALGVVGGTAMAFYNHRVSAVMPANLGSFTVGTTGSPNVFAQNFLWAVYLGDQSGPTIPAPVAFPEYDLGANSETNMGCWYRDINIEKNTFNVGMGAQYPQFMAHAQRLALEAILWHLPDSSCLGELIYYVPVELTAKVFLQGPYDSTTGLMKDDLRTPTLLIPSAEPYTAINTAFPTSFTKVNNFVTETIVNPTPATVFGVTGSNAIVDWVWLELRDKTDSTIVLATRSALVQRDGDIVDLDGTSAVLFPDSYADEYFVMVRHRNHLGTLTKTKIDLAAAHFVDFTVATQPTVGTTATSARKLIKTATYGLIAGNTIPKIGGGYQVIYNNANNDRAPILNVVGASTPLNTVSNVYMLEDVNMDGKVRYNNVDNDRVIILNNVGASTPLNIVTQQPNF